MDILEAKQIDLSYEEKLIVESLDLSIKEGRIYSLLGPNGSGKSTILKALSRNLKTQKGTVYLDGSAIHKMNTKEVAKIMAVLSQSPQSPPYLTVKDLVEYGRFPHQRFWERLSSEDKEIVSWAIEKTGLTSFTDRLVNTLSGGERQRAWIAMALVQKPSILLLDEPTTFLDIAHQLEVMELVTSINKEYGITIVMVLHDMNHASRYSDELIVLKDGKIFAQGSPIKVMNEHTLKSVFGVEADIWIDKKHGKPVCIAQELAHHAELNDRKNKTLIGG
ncbi:iron complex transport system ATP-binding protein [Evansella vedderi]|uniref:Iron complex transport system ATP-binding protein n=1 Tax=Evansella vedderi TaxID=38282 RepID=A0ABT9ZND5_9BACI|nr:ABC transporter ATP-binding protein [Evansella vedderi]MDQ0252736.1 iron complex transport system ATP-binding protein [Evansella vedderi]